MLVEIACTQFALWSNLVFCVLSRLPHVALKSCAKLLLPLRKCLKTTILVFSSSYLLGFSEVWFRQQKNIQEKYTSQSGGAFRRGTAATHPFFLATCLFDDDCIYTTNTRSHNAPSFSLSHACPAVLLLYRRAGVQDRLCTRYVFPTLHIREI